MAFIGTRKVLHAWEFKETWHGLIQQEVELGLRAWESFSILSAF
jgi:hypothetical protein